MLLKTIFSENLANSQICAISQVHFAALQTMNSPLENRQIFSVKLFVGGLLYRCARQVFAPWGHEKYYFVLSEDDEVNGVIITTITSTHEGLLKRCIQAGKAIFCEKPIAESNERISMLQKVVNDLFKLVQKILIFTKMLLLRKSFNFCLLAVMPGLTFCVGSVGRKNLFF